MFQWSRQGSILYLRDAVIDPIYKHNKENWSQFPGFSHIHVIYNNGEMWCPCARPRQLSTTMQRIDLPIAIPSHFQYIWCCQLTVVLWGNIYPSCHLRLQTLARFAFFFCTSTPPNGHKTIQHMLLKRNLNPFPFFSQSNFRTGWFCHSTAS